MTTECNDHPEKGLFELGFIHQLGMAERSIA
jgi:hypothetical protein